MIILNIGGISDDKSRGPNINVPMCTIYENLYETAGLYNSVDKDVLYRDKINNFFEKKEMKKYDVSSLRKPFNKPDIVVFHSMYIISHVFIARKLRKNNIPYIIVPRGAMTKSAQNKKKIKKIIGNFLIFNSYVKNAIAIQFLTNNEYRESTNFKFKRHIIVGNGVVEKTKIKKYNNKNNKFIVTFIGRIDKYHKGLDYLIDAIKLGEKEFRKRKYIFNLYGPNYEGSLQYLNKLVEKYNLYDIVKFKKPVFDVKKENVLLNSDLFVHTSRLEGHPTSVIDAISYGVPVLVTPGTNLYKEVKDNNLGFVCQFNVKDICNTLLKATDEKENLKKISKTEIEYSKKELLWNTIGKKNLQEYSNILDYVGEKE